MKSYAGRLNAYKTSQRIIALEKDRQRVMHNQQKIYDQLLLLSSANRAATTSTTTGISFVVGVNIGIFALLTLQMALLLAVAGDIHIEVVL